MRPPREVCEKLGSIRFIRRQHSESLVRDARERLPREIENLLNRGWEIESKEEPDKLEQSIYGPHCIRVRFLQPPEHFELLAPDTPSHDAREHLAREIECLLNCGWEIESKKVEEPGKKRVTKQQEQDSSQQFILIPSSFWNKEWVKSIIAILIFFGIVYFWHEAAKYDPTPAVDCNVTDCVAEPE
jgi:hypothetical protein